MGELDRTPESDNVNVTLEPDPVLSGQAFPCPVCGIALPFRFSRKQKPYCVCDSCGIQLFFRGKEGIRLLREIIDSGALITNEGSNLILAIALYNHIQRLRARRKELEAKQGLIFRDPDLDNAILAVDNEIERAQGELDKLAHPSRREKTK